MSAPAADTIEHVSAILSAVTGVSILAASYFQWVSVSYDGKLTLHKWVKVLLAVMIALELAGLGLALAN